MERPHIPGSRHPIQKSMSCTVVAPGLHSPFIVFSMEGVHHSPDLYLDTKKELLHLSLQFFEGHMMLFHKISQKSV